MVLHKGIKTHKTANFASGDSSEDGVVAGHGTTTDQSSQKSSVTKWVLLVAFVLVFGGLGSYFLFASHADSTNMTMYRMSKAPYHFYTTSATEEATAAKNGYSLEASYPFVNEPGSDPVPVYRLSDSVGDHFYTESVSEVTTDEKGGWTDEGVAFYGSSSATVPYGYCRTPWARLLLKGTTVHMYTASATEASNLVKAGTWTEESANAFSLDSACSTNPAPATSSSTGSGSTTTTASTNPPPSGSAPTSTTAPTTTKVDATLYRLYNGSHHFYTASASEEATALKGGFWLEISYPVSYDLGTGSPAVPVYRLYDASTKDHLFTESVTTAGTDEKNGYAMEGTAFYSYPSTTKPAAGYCREGWYELDFAGGNHFYTPNTTEADQNKNAIVSTDAFNVDYPCASNPVSAPAHTTAASSSNSTSSKPTTSPVASTVILAYDGGNDGCGAYATHYSSAGVHVGRDNYGVDSVCRCTYKVNGIDVNVPYEALPGAGGLESGCVEANVTLSTTTHTIATTTSTKTKAPAAPTPTQCAAIGEVAASGTCVARSGTVTVVKVPPAPTSQQCAAIGEIASGGTCKASAGTSVVARVYACAYGKIPGNTASVGYCHYLANGSTHFNTSSSSSSQTGNTCLTGTIKDEVTAALVYPLCVPN